MDHYRKRIVFDTMPHDISVFPMLGIISHGHNPWKYRICFGFLIWRMSIGILKCREKEAQE